MAGPGVISQALRWMLRKESPFYIRPRLDPALLRWAWRFRRYCNFDDAESGYRALLELSRLSLDLFEQLHETFDFFYERKGLLHVYLGEDAGESAQKDGDAMESAGFATRLFDRDGVLEFEPSLSERARAGLFIEGEAHGYSYGYVRALSEFLEKGDSVVLPNRAVSDMRISNGRVRGVRLQSPEEEIEADLVVLAAGSWTPLIAKKLGLTIPLQPAKGYSCTVDIFPGAPTVPLLMPETRVIVTPLDDKIRFGGTLELAGHDLSLDETRYRAVIRGAREVLKTSFEMKNEEAWCGLRPCLPDGLPVIDWVPGIEGLIVASGHAMLGLTQSPGTGRVVSEIADGKTPSVPLEPFRFGRFA
jgi:D-amino-acid dehydrogenase